MNLKAIIATTLPTEERTKFGIVGLQQLQFECRGQTLVYQGELYTVVGSEVVRLAITRPTVDEWALMVELEPVKLSSCVAIVCDSCGSEPHIKPEDVRILGVSLKVMLENNTFQDALIGQLKASGKDLHLESLVERGTIKEEE